MTKRTTEDEPSAKLEVRLLVYRPEARKVLGGVSDRHFARLEAEGVITPTKRRRGKKSVYDLAIITPAFLQYVTAQKPASDRDARTRRDLSTAKLNELKLAQQSSELVSREQVVYEGQLYTRAWRAVVLGWPQRLINAGLIARDQEPAVKAISRELLTEISTWKLADVKKLASVTGDLTLNEEGEQNR
jgi:hypothetical protein